MPYSGALDAAWWAALGAASRWGNVLSLATVTPTYSPAYSAPTTWQPDWIALGISLGAGDEIFQAPLLSAAEDGGSADDDNSYDTGFFWLTSSNGAPRYPAMCAIPGEPNFMGTANNTHSQCIGLVPENLDGELRPMSLGYPMYSAYYKTGFVYPVGNDTSLGHSHTVTWLKCPSVGVYAYVNHYGPYAWSGTPAEVIAAILLQMGLPTTSIDTDRLATIHDTYRSGALVGVDIAGYGAAVDQPWEPVIYCSRRIGQKVSDLLTEVMRHARDMYFVNEAGEFSANSFLDPDDVVDGLDLDDGVISVEWESTTKYVFNSVSAGWGSGYRFSGSPTYAPDIGGFVCQQEDELNSYQASKYVHDATDAASIAKYGAIWLKGRKRITKTSNGREVQTAHYPFYLGPGCDESWWTAYGFGGMMHVTNWLKSDAKERRIVTVVQDFRALDWGIGTLLTNVAVTDDGAVIPEMWCISRTYDFDSLKVTSVLMERPPNT